MTAAIEFSGFDRKCLDLLDTSPKRHSRICLRSAIHHLECADKIAEIDPAMAAFRALTAEEEAASGFMHCLKERGYVNSDKLRPKEHWHKTAIAPFLDVLGMFFAETATSHVKRTVFKLEGDGAERLLMIGHLMFVDDEEQWVTPIPPLNFSVSSDSKALSYRKQIDALVERRGAKDISTYIRDRANLRNQLLYAHPEGYPKDVTPTPDFFLMQRIRVMAMVRAYLLVQPYQELLACVQDSLDAFLLMLGALKDSDLHDTL